jgi:hypothetical protein
VPVILSDDCLWAYSKDTGGSLDPRSFSLQFPQRIVQRTATQLLDEGSAIKNHSFLIKSLPLSNRSLIQLLEEVAIDEMNESRSQTQDLRGINTLLRILLKIPDEDFHHLQQGVRAASHYYSYYRYNQSMKSIPTASHVFPSGGAMETLAHQLSIRKRKGLQRIHHECQAERNRPRHRYIRKYPCEIFKK